MYGMDGNMGNSGAHHKRAQSSSTSISIGDGYNRANSGKKRVDSDEEDDAASLYYDTLPHQQYVSPIADNSHRKKTRASLPNINGNYDKNDLFDTNDAEDNILSTFYSKGFEEGISSPIRRSLMLFQNSPFSDDSDDSANIINLNESDEHVLDDIDDEEEQEQDDDDPLHVKEPLTVSSNGTSLGPHPSTINSGTHSPASVGSLNSTAAIRAALVRASSISDNSQSTYGVPFKRETHPSPLGIPTTSVQQPLSASHSNHVPHISGSPPAPASMLHVLELLETRLSRLENQISIQTQTILDRDREWSEFIRDMAKYLVVSIIPIGFLIRWWIRSITANR